MVSIVIGAILRLAKYDYFLVNYKNVTFTCVHSVINHRKDADTNCHISYNVYVKEINGYNLNIYITVTTV